MTLLAQDSPALTRLVKDFRAIADLLERWIEAEPAADEAGHPMPKYALDEVAEQFSNMLKELRKSGDRGVFAYQHFDAIAHSLRAAADALHKE
jgi:hypothetical protein